MNIFLDNDKLNFNKDLIYVIRYYRSGLIRAWNQPFNIYIKINKTKFRIRLWCYPDGCIKGFWESSGKYKSIVNNFKNLPFDLYALIVSLLQNSTNYQL